MITLTEVYENHSKNTYSMRDILINPQHIIAMREDTQAQMALQENRMPQGLSPNLGFTRIYLNSGQQGLNVLVAGSLDIVQQKIGGTKRVLKG